MKNRFVCLALFFLCPLWLAYIGPLMVTAHPPLESTDRMRTPLATTSQVGPLVLDSCGFGDSLDAGPGTISGIVRDALTQEPISGAVVLVCGYGRGNVAQYGYELYGQGEAVTDNAGRFTISNLPTETNHGPLNYVAIVSPLQSSRPTYEIRPITSLTVTESTQLNVALRPGATFSGLVTDEYSGAPLSGVKAYTHFEAWPISIYSRRLMLSAETDASGHYTITNLSTYNYALFFEPPNPVYISEEYPATPNYNNEFPRFYMNHPISITAGTAASGVDASLQRYSLVSGTVAISATGQPVSGTEVSFILDNPIPLKPLERLHTLTDENGRYTVLIPSGRYHVFFKTPASSGYPCQFYYDYSRPDEYPLYFQVQQPDPLTIDGTLRQPGTITGRVRYPSGRGISTATIQEWNLPDPECNVFNMPYNVEPDGSFEITNLVPRHYKLFVALHNRPFYDYEVLEVAVREGEVISGVEVVLPEPTYLPLVGMDSDTSRP
jgi:hypothetical protein